VKFALTTGHISIDYNKKKDKKASIKFVKDPSARTDDVYKSSTVTVGQGEPPNSGPFTLAPLQRHPLTDAERLLTVSRPMPKRKPRPAKQAKTNAATVSATWCELNAKHVAD